MPLTTGVGKLLPKPKKRNGLALKTGKSKGRKFDWNTKKAISEQNGLPQHQIGYQI
jgi:hypothetical protein